MANSVRRLSGRISARNASLLVCDIQEKFRDYSCYFDQMVQVTNRLIAASKILEIPIIATEQYPKGLGHLVPELDIDKAKTPIVEKSCFSMCGVPEIQQFLHKDKKRDTVILCGIEAHVCVYHTAMDLFEQGFSVHVVADATSSRSMVDRAFAYRQLEQAGIAVTTSECAIFSMLRGSDHPQFKQVQKIVLQQGPDTGLLDVVNMTEPKQKM